LLNPPQGLPLNYVSLKFISVNFKNPCSTLQKDIFHLCHKDKIIEVVYGNNDFLQDETCAQSVGPK
jgi:hypothetical protein